MTVKIHPGMMPATKSLAIDVSVRIPNIIRLRLGGISVASEPALANTAARKFLLYLYLLASGITTGPKAVMAAAIDPLTAPNRAQAITTAIARPPCSLSLPSRLVASSKSLLVIPDRNRNSPIKR